MILYELCFGNDNNDIFCLEICYKYFTDVCSKYKLNEKGIFKEYNIDNKTILKSHGNTEVFSNTYLETELIKGNLLIKKEIIIEKDLNLEQFYNPDNESKYILYESIIKDVHIICKKFPNYFTLTYESDKKENILNLLETLKNIYY
tara:strand:- start:624 stop:1061 length:438 start_codon:yes stop_codon:yes gene_type:complete